MADVHITVSRALGVPLVTQIRDQVVSAISVGDLKAGQRLPAVRQLAAFLGINRNTVAQAYRLLENDGHVVTRAGGGTLVAGDPDTAPALAPSELREIVRAAFEQARTAGYSPRQLAELAYYESARLDASPAPRIVVIDDYRGEMDFVCATIRRSLPGSVVDPILVPDLLAADPAALADRLADADCALVAFYCLENVRGILTEANLPIVAAGIGPSLNSLRRIAEESAGKQVAIVCTEPDGPAHMEAALRRAEIAFATDPHHTHLGDEHLAETLDGCEIIIASQGSADTVRALAGTTPVIAYSHLISQETLATLRSYTDYMAAQAATS